MGPTQNRDMPEEDKKSDKEHVVNKALRGRGEKEQEGQDKKKKAHIPSTVMTVEYLDDSKGVDEAIKSVAQRLSKVEERLQNLEQAHTEMVAVINRQAKEIRDLATALTRRMDHLYRAVSAGGQEFDLAAEEEVDISAELDEVPQGLPDEFSDDEHHQQAFRVARVLMADLEAYYPNKVREGVLYGNLQEVLTEELEEARNTYEERVPERVREEFDHFAAALKGLIIRRKREIDEEEEAE